MSTLDFDNDFFDLDDNLFKKNSLDYQPDNKLKLSNGNIITFNEQQIEGISKIRGWLKNKGKKFFTLAGAAGTGKSSILKKITDNYRGRVGISAPTHKAKRVVAKMTELDGVTLHSILGLRPDLDLDNFNPNKPEFSPIAEIKMYQYDLLVIDESSMINLGLLNMIKDVAKIVDIKILFIGDPAQIPPVGEKASAVFSDESIEIHWLTKVERQKGSNPLCLIYDKLRNNQKEDYIDYPRVTNINELGEGIYFLSNKEEFRLSLIKKFNSPEFKADSDFVKLIAWRNITVMNSNKIIRNEIFGDNSDIVEIGDIFMGYRSISDSKGYTNIIENSCDYAVTEKSKRFMNRFGVYGYDIKIKEEVENKRLKFKNIFLVDTSDLDNVHNYAERHDNLKHIAKVNKKMWKDYYTFRRESILNVSIDEYANGTKRPSSEVIAKDIDYGYAITAHKSQSSTYTHVFIIEDDINMNPKIRERNQILYVAYTRPTTTATILSSRF